MVAAKGIAGGPRDAYGRAMDLGTALQVGGLIIALVALGWELWVVREAPDPVGLPDVDDALKQPNPWDPAAFNRLPPQSRPGAGDPRNPTGLLQDAANQLIRFAEQDRKQAETAWKHQTLIMADLADANRRLLAAQLAQIVGAQRHTRIRVWVEMSGLLLALVGTAIG